MPEANTGAESELQNERRRPEVLDGFAVASPPVRWSVGAQVPCVRESESARAIGA